jgi:hypothetical protein
MIVDFNRSGADETAESRYEDWLQSHAEDGLVFNHFGRTAEFNVLHRANCWTLRRNVDAGSRTIVPKVCSTARGALESEITRRTGAASLWRHCKICKPGAEPVADASPAVTALDQPSSETDGDTIWIPGQPRVWIGSGWEAWVAQLIDRFGPWRGRRPESFDMVFVVDESRLLNVDLDNLITPVLDALRDADVIETGFQRVGTVHARKQTASDTGVLVRTGLPESVAPRAGVLIEVELESRSEDAVKRAVYQRAAEVYWSRPALAVPAQESIAVDVSVELTGRRKSIRDLLKPCIDGLEPILSCPDGRTPLTLDELAEGKWRTLAPQDEMIMELRMDVRGGPRDLLSAVVSVS